MHVVLAATPRFWDLVKSSFDGAVDQAIALGAEETTAEERALAETVALLGGRFHTIITGGAQVDLRDVYILRTAQVSYSCPAS